MDNGQKKRSGQRGARMAQQQNGKEEKSPAEAVATFEEAVAELRRKLQQCTAGEVARISNLLGPLREEVSRQSDILFMLDVSP